MRRGRALTGSFWRSGSAQAFLFGTAFLYLFGLGGTFPGSLSWEYKLVNHAVASVVLLAAGLHLWRSRSPRSIEVPPWPLCACLGLILATKFVALLFQPSWQARADLAESITTVLLFLVLVGWSARREPLACSFVFAATICALAGYLWSLEGGYRELALPLGNRTLMAGLLLLAVGPAIGLTVGARKWWPAKSLALCGSMVLLGGIILTRSAAAFLVLGVMAVVFSSAVFFSRGFHRRGVLVAGCLTSLAACGYGGSGAPERLEAVLTGKDDPLLSWNNRLRYWEGSWEAISERPILGFGAGQVGVVYPKYRLQQPGLAPRGEVVPDLHSTPMNWLFEYGLAGTMLRIAAFCWFVGAAWSGGAGFARWSAGALGAYGIYGCVHYQLTSPALIAALVCVAALAAPRRRLLVSTVHARWLAGGIICLGAAVSGLWVGPVYANYLLDRSPEQEARVAVPLLEKAARADSRSGFYDFLAALRMERPETVRDGLDSPFTSEVVEIRYRSALARNPHMAIMLSAFGRFLLTEGRACEAVGVLQEAVALDFYYSLSHFDLANSYAKCSQARLAVEEAAVAVLTNPSLVYSDVWRADPRFLRAAIGTATGWALSWEPPKSEASVARLTELIQFLEVRADDVVGHSALAATFTLSEVVASDLTDDPFAFLLQRRSPRFTTTEILLRGPESGSWAPMGIGSVRFLRAVRLDEVRAAYSDGQIANLVLSLGGSPIACGSDQVSTAAESAHHFRPSPAPGLRYEGRDKKTGDRTRAAQDQGGDTGQRTKTAACGCQNRALS